MPLYSTLASLSQTPASNAADGSNDAPSTIDQQTNLLASFIAQLRDGVGFTGSLATKNRLINSNFAINQRSVSGSVALAAGIYGHDRWKAGASGCTYTFVTSGIDTVITISAGSLIQVVEGVDLEGGNYVLSWTGTAQGKIGAGAFSASGVTATGVTAAANLNVEFGIGSISKAQLEPGLIASSFERRGLGPELQRCQRYFEIGTTQTGGAYPTGSSGATTICEIPFKTFKRAVPTMAQLGSSSSSNVSANTFLTPGPSGCGLSVTIGASVGNYSLSLDWTASAEL